MLKLMFITLALVTTAIPAARAQEVAAGQDSFNRICTICHAVGEGAQNKLGPIRNGLEGRRSGTVEGFNYSDTPSRTRALSGARPRSRSSCRIQPGKFLGLE